MAENHYDLDYTGSMVDRILDTGYDLQNQGYIFRGLASHYTGTPTERTWLIAPTGSTGFGLSSPVPPGSIGICMYNGSSWSAEVLNTLTLDSAPTTGSGNGITSGAVKTLAESITNAIGQLEQSVSDRFTSLELEDTTGSLQAEVLSITLKYVFEGETEALTSLSILAATSEKAGLMSAADKQKLDAFVTNIRSLRIQDTTAQADQGTEITNTLRWTIEGVTEAITAFTLYAATTSKAGLMSAADKTALDTLPSLINAGYLYAGIATPSTVPSSTDAKIFYIAIEGGTYTNFDNLNVTQGINIIYKSGNAWSVAHAVGIDDEPTAGSDNLVKSVGVFNNLSAFDISELNATENPHILATYTNLSAALKALPDKFRKGGMSVKFVQSSDNKYVQYRYMGTDVTTAAFINTANWQEQDNQHIIGQYFIYDGFKINPSGAAEGTVTGIACTDFLPITRKEPIICAGLWGYTTVIPLAYYDKDKNFISAITGTDDVDLNIEVANIPSDAYYIRCTANLSRSGEHIIKSGVSLTSVIHNINKAEDAIKRTLDKVSELDEEAFAESLYTGIPYVMRNTIFDVNQDKYVDSSGWDVLHIKLDDGSTFVVENPDNVNVASYAWFSTLNPSAASYLGAGNTKRDGAKLCIIHIRYYTSTLQNYLNFRVIQDSTCIDISKVPDKQNTELATHKLSIRNLTSSDLEKVEGKYIALRSGVVQEVELASMNHYDVTIDHTKEYRVSNAGVTSSSYVLYVIGYYNETDGWFAVEKLVTGQIVNSYYLNIPENATKFAVNCQNTVGNPVIEEIVIEDEIILSDNLQKEIERLSGTSKTKVVVSSGTILVRNHLNSIEDIITKYQVGENNQYTWIATYLGNQSDSDEVILTRMIQELGDTTGAFAVSSDAPWHMWVQHGYCIPYVTVNSQSLTSEDVGSMWKDQLDREYTIGKIEGNNIYLIPVVLPTDIDGVYTRGWKTPSSPGITQLTHISGATHTEIVTVASTQSTQIRPFMVNRKRVLLADGVEVGNGTYHCTDFVISETFDCTDPWTIQTFFPEIIQEEVGAELTQSFFIHGLSCRYDTILNMKKPYKFSWYGANQIRHFASVNTLEGYTPYGMMPRVKKEFNGIALSQPHDISNLSRGSEFALRREADLYDVDKIPDRYISWMQKGNDRKIGCASGLSLTRGITVDAERNINIPLYESGYEDCISCASALTNKVYLKGIVKDNYENNVLPASFIGLFSTYFCYFNPNENTGQVYWYKDGNGFVIYAHYQEAYSKLAINLPNEMNGLSVEVVDKTDGVTLLTDVIEGGKLYISANSDNYNYVVLKTK